MVWATGSLLQAFRNLPCQLLQLGGDALSVEADTFQEPEFERGHSPGPHRPSLAIVRKCFVKPSQSHFVDVRRGALDDRIHGLPKGPLSQPVIGACCVRQPTPTAVQRFHRSATLRLTADRLDPLANGRVTDKKASMKLAASCTPMPSLPASPYSVWPKTMPKLIA
jgi:hypothetical protein